MSVTRLISSTGWSLPIVPGIVRCTYPPSIPTMGGRLRDDEWARGLVGDRKGAGVETSQHVDEVVVCVGFCNHPYCFQSVSVHDLL